MTEFYKRLFLLHYEVINYPVGDYRIKECVLTMDKELESIIDLFNSPENKEFYDDLESNMADILISFETLKDTL